MKYYLIFLIVVFNNLYSYKAKDINDFYNNYYSANYNLSDLQKNNSLTYEKISFGGKTKDIYKKVLEKDSNNFFALLGTAIGYMHAPAIAGGSDKKAFEYFNKALYNSNQKYQKYLSFVWLSQYYFKIKDNENYKKYIDMSIEIYPNGDLLKEAINRNNNNKKPL